ncbi:hypothetical protein ACFOLJ_09815 [Rugamonas sp. CCM 8940]|uniref:hypothetical protein n=1 Tax=Rugamonas sp. CCM 8940 TaxID=2765359 RepID=UPI0018F73CD6|nr:hypothetical protein [Rugamonas sp. CCM 8940]MBJ7313343.1 hypothetical protein [Rugamonas sp. CCM 8940]
MNLTLASTASPKYFMPVSGVASTVDYRGGLVRELAQRVQGVSKHHRNVFSKMSWQLDQLGSSALMDAYAAQLDEIERLRAVPANWSTLPVAAPNAEQLASAQRGLLMLLLEGVPAPKVMLMNDGTLAAFWRHSDMYASIDFDTDGEFPWSAARELDVTSGSWSGGTLPPQLRDVIGA